MRIAYTAKRNLASGHSALTTYNLDAYTTEPVATLAEQRTRQVAIDGTEENQLLRIERTWTIITDQYSRLGSAPTGRDLMLEFIASVMAGEAFTFDPYRLPGGGADIAPRSVTLVSGTFAETPIDPGSATYTATFQVRDVTMIS